MTASHGPASEGRAAVPRIPYLGPVTVGATRGLLDSAQRYGA
jgi:hypothetical protein